MKVLLLHPEDTFPLYRSPVRWDLVVDLARTPSATYEHWSREAGCEIFSLYRFAAEFGDVGRVRELLELGLGVMVDRSGIDWWDLLCLFIAGELQQLCSFAGSRKSCREAANCIQVGPILSPRLCRDFSAPD